MQDLIHWFIETASLSGEHLAGMLFAGTLVLCILLFTAYQVLDLLVGWAKRIKPIQINRIEKIEKVVEVPKYVTNNFNKEVEQQLKNLAKKVETLQKDSVKL